MIFAWSERKDQGVKFIVLMVGIRVVQDYFEVYIATNDLDIGYVFRRK